MNINLNYEGFEKNLVSRGESYGGIHYVFKFENDYGASVIKHNGSYGHERDLWELAVIHYATPEEWDLDYDTDITGDVIGNVTDEEIRNLLERIKALA